MLTVFKKSNKEYVVVNSFICVVKKLQLQSPKKCRIANELVIPDCRLARRENIEHYIFKLLGEAKLTK